MVTPGELTAESLVIIGQMDSSLVSDIVLTRPLSAISLLIGVILTVFPMVVLGYLALGALGDAISRNLGSIGRTPPRRE